MSLRQLSAVLAATAIPVAVSAQRAEPVAVSFVSEGDYVRGRFFETTDGPPVGTLVLVPGYPGNPNDVLGLGALLAERGVNVLMFNPRGLYASSGSFSFPHTLADIAAALRWLKEPAARSRFRIDTARIALGGHSFGGGLALAYAAGDPSIRRVISVAGNDHGVFIRRVLRDSAYARGIRRMLEGTRDPEGPARYESVQEQLDLLAAHQGTYGLRENAPRLADRAVLLIGGLDDTQVTMEDVLLPLYRALQDAGARDVSFLAYQADHGFGPVRERMADDIGGWLERRPPP
jgi:pimeloyl-ACP methyl ester carboxylesterase